MKFFEIGLIALGVAVASSCNRSDADNKKAADTTTVEPVIEKIILKRDTLRSSLTIPGELIAYQHVDLYAKVTGFVKDLNVDIGSKVKEGQVLMTLEAPEVMAQLSAAQSRLKSQEALYTASLANYNRLIETSKTPGTISQNDLEKRTRRETLISLTWMRRRLP